MVTWNEFRSREPDMAQRVQTMFDTRRHKTIATIRADGSPRISGIECEFTDDRLTFGSMPDSRKLGDLRRDPRIALHGPTVDPVEGDDAAWPGEAKIAGRAIPIGTIAGTDGPPGEMFEVDVTEVVVVHLDATGTELVIDWWTPDGGRRRVERQ